MVADGYQLGTVDASQALLGDLYLRLRRDLHSWSELTHQTPQPRMGYIGQHLTSVVTGLSGSRSAARGKDLVEADGGGSEIKTCYRVDQLGSCRECGAPVASIEFVCPACGSENILRKDDSKWLISPKHDADMRSLFEPKSYYLVLFDFEDLDTPSLINVRIWEVNPRSKGFSYCMVDYYFNIKPKSKSGAPFNLWPFSPKFRMMRPKLIYHSLIESDDTIRTLVFPGEQTDGAPPDVAPLTEFARAKIPATVFGKVALRRGLAARDDEGKPSILRRLEEARVREAWDSAELADEIAEEYYGPLIADHREWLPTALQ